MDNYEQLLEKISIASKIAKEEIQKKVEAKRAKLSGLVSKEGAAQIVAAELGINFDKERMKISELTQGMKKANILGKVLNLSPIRTFEKNGREGKVVNLSVADESSNIKVVLWDTNHISYIEQGKIKENDIVEISNAQVRNGELHLSSFSDIKLSKEKMDNVVSQKIFSINNISEAKSGSMIKTRAFILQIFEPRYFEVCPECGKRAFEGECKIHGRVEPKKKALLNLVLDDGTESIRAVLFGEQIISLGLNEEEIFNLEKSHEKKNDFLGEEKVFSGNIKVNSLYNTLEFNVDLVSNINIDELITELEAKV